MIIPFFDGFYIKALDKVFDQGLADLIADFNKKYKRENRIEFLEKEILPDFTYLTDLTKGMKFKQIHTWLSNQKNQSKASRFLELSEGTSKWIKKLSNLQRSQEFFVKEITKYNSYIKASFYQTLLKDDYDYKTPDDVDKVVAALIGSPKKKRKETLEDVNLYLDKETVITESEKR